MAADPAALEVIARFRAASDRRRAQILAYLTFNWDALQGFSPEEVAAFVGAVIPAMEGAQAQTAAATDAYLATIERALLGTTARPVGLPPETVTTEALRGVPALELWRRPFADVRRAVAEGATLEEAMSRGLTRGQQLATTMLELAHTHAVAKVLGGHRGVVAYRRVPRRGTCSLCAGAAHARYAPGALMPIHPGCRCTVHPIYRSARDPGELVHELERTAAVEVVVHEHGEIGPVLATRGQAWTGPSDLAVAN